MSLRQEQTVAMLAISLLMAGVIVLLHVRCSALSLSHIQFFAIPWTTSCQGPLSMQFSRQEYLSGLPCPPPGNLPNPGIKPRSPELQADSLLIESPGKPVLLHWFSSVAQSCLTLCDPMDCSIPGFPVHHQLLELAQIHVH